MHNHKLTCLITIFIVLFIGSLNRDLLTLANFNLLAIAACVLSSFFLGGLWYNLLFRKFYGEECKDNKPTHPAIVFLSAFILWIISAFAFSLLLGKTPELWTAIRLGLITGIGFVSTSFGVNYAFSSKRFGIFLIDAGYHTIQFTLYGVILGLYS